MWTKNLVRELENHTIKGLLLLGVTGAIVGCAARRPVSLDFPTADSTGITETGERRILKGNRQQAQELALQDALLRVARQIGLQAINGLTEHRLVMEPSGRRSETLEKRSREFILSLFAGYRQTSLEKRGHAHVRVYLSKADIEEARRRLAIFEQANVAAIDDLIRKASEERMSRQALVLYDMALENLEEINGRVFFPLLEAKARAGRGPMRERVSLADNAYAKALKSAQAGFLVSAARTLSGIPLSDRDASRDEELNQLIAAQQIEARQEFSRGEALLRAGMYAQALDHYALASTLNRDDSEFQRMLSERRTVVKRNVVFAVSHQMDEIERKLNNLIERRRLR